MRREKEEGIREMTVSCGWNVGKDFAMYVVMNDGLITEMPVKGFCSCCIEFVLPFCVFRLFIFHY